MKSTSSLRARTSARILAGSIAALVTAGFLAAPEPAQAVGLWTGNVDGTWTGLNWDVAPSALDPLVFADANLTGALATATTNGLLAAVAGITFNGVSYSIGGSAFTLNGAINTTGAATISANVTLGAGGGSLVTNAASSLNFTGTFDAGSQALNLSGAGDVAFSSAITTATTLTNSSSGTLTLAGSNAFSTLSTSAGTITGGTLSLSGGATALTSSATSAVNSDVTIITSAGTITSSTAANTLTLGGTLDAGSMALAFDGAGNTTVTNAIANVTTLTKSGAGILTLSGPSIYTGATSVTAGTLKAGVASVANTSGAFGNNSAVSLSNVAGAILDITGFNTQIGSLTGGGATGGNVTLGAATLTVGGDDTSPAAYAGVLSGTGGALTKIGAGTLTLSGANTYTGKTIIQAGTLKIGRGNETDSTALTNAGVAGPLGAPTGANSIIDMHNGTTLQTGNTGPRVNQETDRTINLAGTGAGTVTISVNDNDTYFKFGAVTATGTGAKTLVLVVGYNGNADRETVTFNGAISELSAADPLSLQVTFNGGGAASRYVNLKSGGTFTGPITVTRPDGTDDAYLTIGGVKSPSGAQNGVTTPSTSGSGTLNSGSYAGNISLAAKTNLYYYSSAAQTLSGVISGAGSLTKDVAGSTLTLTGSNNYTGTTTITGGTLRVGNGGTTGTLGTGNTTNNAALVFNRSDASSYSGAISGTGSVTKEGAGTTTLSGANSYTGATTVTAGVLSVATIGNGGVSGNLGSATSAAANLVFNGGTLQYTGATASTDRNFTINAGTTATFDITANHLTVTGASTATNGALTKIGAGTLTLGGVNTYTGATTISAGILKLQPGVATPVAGYARWFDASTIAGGNGASISTWNDLSGNSANATVPGGNSAPTKILDAGTGTGLSALQFAKNNNATDSGALTFTRDSSIRSVFSIFKGAAFLLTDTNTYQFHRGGPTYNVDATDVLWDGGYSSSNIRNGTTYVNGTAVNGTTFAMPTNLHNGYNLVSLITAGNVEANGFNRDRIYNSGNQSQAEVLIYDFALDNTQRLAVEAYLNAKWFGIGSTSVAPLSSASPVSIAASATLDLNGVTQQIASLSGPGGSSVTNSGVTDSLLTISGASNTDFGGVISNGGTNKISLGKSGASIQTLSGANTYTGATTITAGTLKAGVASVANTSGAFGNNSAVSLANVAGATMDITGFNTQIGSLTGGGATGGHVTLGSATLTVGGDNTSPAAYAGVLSGTSGALTKIGTGTQTLSGANTYTGSTTVNGGGLTLTASGLIAAASNIQVDSGTLTITDGGGGRTLANNMVLNGGAVMVQGFLDNTGTGGTITFSMGNVIHTFTASGSLVLPTSVASASELIVGAGGGGGAGVYFNVYNAGGGGGKVSNLTGQTLAAGSTAVVVGAGGAGANDAPGASGGASSIGGNTAAGGSGANDGNGTGGTSGSGIAGAGRNNGYWGGGGAGDSATGSGHHGGAGTLGTITGSFYGGGGGGGSDGATGMGADGGGNGHVSGIGTSGTVNTGGGGGSGAAGGSGIVIVQYAYATVVSGAVTLSGAIDLQSASTLDAYAAGALLDATGLISTSAGSGGLTIASSSASGGVVRFGSANTYVGNTTVNSGATLRMNATNALPFGSGKGNLSLSGTLDLNGQATTSLNGLSGAGTINNQTGAGAYALSVGNNNQTSAFSGVIQNTTGTLGLTKAGTGTLTLSGANTYAGTTTISAGTLEVSGGAAIANAGAVSIASVAGARLLVSASETIGSLNGGSGANGEVALGSNTLTVGDASTMTFGGTISGAGGTLVKQGAGTLNLAVGSVQTYGTLSATAGTTNVNSVLGTGTSAVSVTGATTLKFGSVSQTLGSLSIGAGSTVTFTSGLASFSGGGGKAPGFGGGGAVVPEPGTLGLLLVGALGVLNRRRRQA